MRRDRPDASPPCFFLLWLESEAILQPAEDEGLGFRRHVGRRLHRLVDAIDDGLVLAELLVDEGEDLRVGGHLLGRVAVVIGRTSWRERGGPDLAILVVAFS